MSNETLRLAEAMEAEMHNELTLELGWAAAAEAKGNLDELDSSMEVRVQFIPDDDDEAATYTLHTGDAQYDTDHRGFWGAATMSLPASPAERIRVARELVDDLLESISQAE